MPDIDDGEDLVSVLGMGEPGRLLCPSLNAALSAYRPPAVVADIALDVEGRGRYEVRPERGSRVEARKRVDGKRDILGLDFYDEVDGALYHLQEWVNCVRSRETPSCPAEEGVRSAAAAHMANLSYRSGRVARWSDVAVG